MFDFLALVKVVNALEILVAEAIFCAKFKRRRFFWLRWALVVCAMLAWALFIHPLDDPSLLPRMWSGIYMFLPIWAISAAGIFFCFDESFYACAMAATAGYTTEKIGSLIQSLISTVKPDILNLVVANRFNIWAFLIIFVCDIGTYVACYFLFARPIQRDIEKEKPTLERFILLLVAAFVNLIFGLIYSFGIVGNPKSLMLVMGYLMNLLCCILILFIMAGFFRRDAAEVELEQNKKIYAISKENYKNEKKTTEIINQKVHDLKHRVYELMENKNADFSDIEKVVDIYDSSIHTNNEALDIVCQQKQLFCQKENIQLSLVANAEKLSFMRSTDIFVLFGNLFDNAIHAVEKIEDPKRRIIYVRIFEKSGILIIGFENEYAEELIVENGEYKTTNPHKEGHGYGVKSIKEIVANYEGTIRMSSKDHFFKTNISFLLHK